MDKFSENLGWCKPLFAYESGDATIIVNDEDEAIDVMKIEKEGVSEYYDRAGHELSMEEAAKRLGVDIGDIDDPPLYTFYWLEKGCGYCPFFNDCDAMDDEEFDDEVDEEYNEDN